MDMKDSVHVGDNNVGPKVGNLNIEFPQSNSIPICPVCNTPLSNNPALNNGLVCGNDGCGKRFCEQCESFYRAVRRRGEMPYCKDHYTIEENPAADKQITDPLLSLAAELGVASVEDIPAGVPHSVIKPEAPLPVPQMIQMTLKSKTLYNSIALQIGSIYGGIGQMPDSLDLSCSFKNEFPRTIRAFKGSVRFSDLFHHHILSMGVTIELIISPMKSVDWTGTTSYNQFIDSHVRLGSINLNDLNYELELESVVFTDGTRIPN
tara:strand:- start:1698 stop:2486 length:789 start_codon:yes stop_codon:yes gene_type:complete